MFTKDQLVTFTARVVSAKDRGNIVLTIDDPGNPREYFFTIDARLLELGIARPLGGMIGEISPERNERTEPVPPEPRRGWLGRAKLPEAP